MKTANAKVNTVRFVKQINLLSMVTLNSAQLKQTRKRHLYDIVL